MGSSPLPLKVLLPLRAPRPEQRSPQHSKSQRLKKLPQTRGQCQAKRLKDTFGVLRIGVAQAVFLSPAKKGPF